MCFSRRSCDHKLIEAKLAEQADVQCKCQSEQHFMRSPIGAVGAMKAPNPVAQTLFKGPYSIIYGP